MQNRFLFFDFAFLSWRKSVFVVQSCFSAFIENRRLVFGAIALASFALLGFGLYLQHSVGLDPCPMCIVQRYALTAMGAAAALAAVFAGGWGAVFSGFTLIFAGFGAFVAARQSWLQWFPPEVASCGRDFYGIVENYPISRALPMLFRGSGDCAAVDWTFLGGSIANWSFVCFVGLGIFAVWGLYKSRPPCPLEDY